MTALHSSWIRTVAAALVLVAVVSAERVGRGVSPTGQGDAVRGFRPAGPVTAAQYERWKTELSNWGRWGKDDQIGTLNLITPAKRRQAAALVRDGVSVSLAGDADTQKAVDNPAPYEHAMLGLGADRIGVAYHGIAHTHPAPWNPTTATGGSTNASTPDRAPVPKAAHHPTPTPTVKNG